MTLRETIAHVDIRTIIRQALMIGPMYELEIRVDVATEVIVNEIVNILERKFDFKEKP